MRKLLVFVGLMSIFVVYFFVVREKNGILPLLPLVSPTPVPTIHPSLKISYNDIEYNVAYYQVRDVSSLELLPNFTEKKSALNLQMDNKCTALVNAGFYTPESEPTGLFISHNKVLKQATSSTLLDGFVIESGNEVYIGSVPQMDAYWALQTGPRLFINGQKRSLSLVRDEYARRIVALNTSRGEFYVLAFYLSSNAYDGPRLADLPEVLNLVQKQLQFIIVDAINLDGGSASAFLTPDIKLSELTSIGSYFCVKN